MMSDSLSDQSIFLSQDLSITEDNGRSPSISPPKASRRPSRQKNLPEI